MSMKIINSAELTALPNEVRALIRSGIYSLYVFAGGGAAAYLLATNRNEFYLLSSAGQPLPSCDVANLDDVRIREAVSFSDTRDTRGLNFSWA